MKWPAEPGRQLAQHKHLPGCENPQDSGSYCGARQLRFYSDSSTCSNGGIRPVPFLPLSQFSCLLNGDTNSVHSAGLLEAGNECLAHVKCQLLK